jgi:hypothetical protein
MSDIKKVASLSPGVATAALQSGASKDEINKLVSLFEIQNIHNTLTSLPQNDAYSRYQNLPKPTQNALSSMFHPKYIKEDKGFFKNLLGNIKSAVWYGGSTTGDLVKQVAGILNPAATVSKAAIVAGKTILETEKISTPLGKVADALVRPQNKLVKQPYAAQRLAEEAGEGNWLTFGRFLAEGAKELLPGGQDAQVTDNATNFMKYWEQASDAENVFDTSKVAELDARFTPEVAFVGKLLASRKNLVDAFDTYSNDPEIVSLIARYTSGDPEAKELIGTAVANYEKSKVSMGRDIARPLVELFPHDAERAIMGDGNAKAFFNAISGTIDFGVTLGLDPLILGGKANRALDAARFGLIKVGTNPQDLAKAWERTDVQEYWNTAGKLLDDYRSPDFKKKGAALTRLQDRYKELSFDVINDLAKAGVKDADSALTYFDDGTIISALMRGNAGLARTPLIPRYTKYRKIQDSVKDTFSNALGTNRLENASDIATNVDEFVKLIDANPIAWANKIGVDEVRKVGGGNVELVQYTPRDLSVAARVDRVVKQLNIAPTSERIISISDDTSANQVYKLVRSVGVSKRGASDFRGAWVAADEGQRLLMYKGLLKTLGYGMGLDHTEEGLKILASIDDFSRELYSVNQSALDLGDLAAAIGTVSLSGKSMPQGVRKIVQDATDTLTAEGKANRLLASVGGEMKDLAEQLRVLRLAKKEADIAGDLETINAIAEQTKIVGGRFFKTKQAYLKLKNTAAKESGTLPKDFRFVLRENSEVTHRIAVHNSSDIEVGNLNWDKITGEITNLDVEKGYQRKGIATAMFNEARKISRENDFVTPVHSKTLSPDAEKWIKSLKPEIEMVDDLDEIAPIDALDLGRFNAAEMNGQQFAVRQYQLNQQRALPNLDEWRAFAARSGVAKAVLGKVSDAHTSRVVTDAWSFGNLYPRLGIRTTVEEVGTYGIISGSEGFGNYLKGRIASRELRAAQLPSKKTTIIGSKEIESPNLGILYNNLYKITRKHYSKEDLLAMADNPEELGAAVANAVIKNRFKPSLFNTKAGQRLADYTQDFARFNGKTVLDDINGASTRAERTMSEVEQTANSLKDFGPSIALNVDVVESMKGLKFGKEFTEIGYKDDKFLLNWYFELQNTVGKKNGKFGNIVLWNIGKKEDEVVALLRNYIDGEGNKLAQRFAIYGAEGSEGLARRIYADATYPLRDSAGRINKKLVQTIRDKGGMDEFTLDDLVKIDVDYARPRSIMGKEIIPLGAGNPEQAIYRVINNGYGWVGRQIALLDREPILLGNYTMFRDDLQPYQALIKRNALAAGADDATADAMSRLAAHDSALDAARMRTLGYVDNSEVRTNLAFNLRTFGRYYRATEDFYRRVARIGKYEKRALVRLAIANQSFENSGFVHTDDQGELYFTYPGDDILNVVLGETLFRAFGMSGAQPLPVNFGGKVKMLTPSLDPQSAAPRLGGPLVSLSFAFFENLPYVGQYIKGVEQVATGSYNVDAPLWRKLLPANAQRLGDMFYGGSATSDYRFSAIIQAMKMNIANGNGPTKPSEIDKFLQDATIQGVNVQAIRFVSGLGTPASVQLFANKDIPKELINAGVFTWDSEFQKFIARYSGDPKAFSKALVDFAKIYPSKLVFTTAKTSAGTEANFQKTYEAADFVKKNKQLMLEHKQGASFFIPISGTSDYESYAYLKAQGLVKNKDLDDFLLEASTAQARKTYYELSDSYNEKIANAANPMDKRYFREQLTMAQNGLKVAYPLLNTYLGTQPGSARSKQDALDDLREVIYSGKAPDKQLSQVYSAMIGTYDAAQAQLRSSQGSSSLMEMRRKEIKADLKDTLVTIAKDNPNAQSLYWIVFDSLIGE